MVCATSKGSDHPTDQSLCWSLAYSMTVKLVTGQHFGFLSLKGSCTGSSESTLVKIPYCWKAHVTAHMQLSPLVAVAGGDSVVLVLIVIEALCYVFALHYLCFAICLCHYKSCFFICTRVSQK